MEYRYRKKLWFRFTKKAVWLIAVASGLLALLAVGFVFYQRTTKPKPLSNGAPLSVQPTPTVSNEAEAQTLAGRYLFNGTIFWGRGIENWSKRSDGSLDFERPFSGLNGFKPEQYDAWEADLECPITDRLISFQEQINTLMFNCRPEYLPAMAKYFQIINLANNHTDNRGPEGLEETRKRLDEAGVQYFGSYDPSVQDKVCEVVALPVRLQSETDKNSSDASSLTGEKSHLPVAFCAWHYFYRKPQPGEIEVMQRYQKVMPVFAFLHMGAEYNAEATAVQREIAHAVADQKPEFVIANNPHWVQDSEVYNGRLIVYSTGNFIFDQLDFETQRSASIDVTITSPVDDNLRQWLKIGEQCSGYQDTCLQTIEAAHLTKPKLTYRYDAVAGDSSNKLTKYNPTLQQGVYDRLKWSAVQSAL